MIATVLGVLALHITPADLAQRWTAGGNDQILHYTIFGSAQDVFPYFPNTQLGFPASQNLLFSPLFDPWSALFVAVVGPFVPNGIWVLNLFYVAGFAGIGATGYLFFRALRVRPSIATVFGVIGAVLPYHFVRIDYGHPFLANYWSVPLIGILVLVVAGPATDPVARLVSGISSTRRRRIVTAALLVALTAGVAWTVSYYYVFGAIILGTTWAVSVVAALIGRRPLRTLAWPTFTLGSLGLLIAVQVGVLSLNFGERYTKYFSGRTPQESEYYGGKLQQLLLPSTTSGFPPSATSPPTTSPRRRSSRAARTRRPPSSPRSRSSWSWRSSSCAWSRARRSAAATLGPASSGSSTIRASAPSRSPSSSRSSSSSSAASARCSPTT